MSGRYTGSEGGERLTRAVLADHDKRLNKAENDDVEISGPRRLYIQSPNGHFWSIGVDNAGNLATTDRDAFSPAALFAGGEGGAWYDPSDLSTLFQDTAGTTPVTADGQSVARINDKSGNAQHLTQATAGNRPIYKTSGGLSWLEFTAASSQYLTCGDALDLGTGGMWGAAAARLSAAASQSIFAKSFFGAQPDRYALVKDSGNLTSIAQPASGSAPKSVAYASTVDAVLTAKLDRANGTNGLRIDGVAQGSDATFTPESSNANTAYSFFVGAYNDTAGTGPQAGYYLDGRIYGLVIQLEAALSDTEIAETETWLGAKAGLSI